jgi:anti-sigma B factor antagonist
LGDDKQQQDNEARLIQPVGRMDSVTAATFRAEVRKLVDTGATWLVLDLSEVSFLDSAGLGAILSGLRLVREAGGDLRLARPSPQASAVLKLTSLSKVLPVYPSVEAALDTFG